MALVCDIKSMETEEAKPEASFVEEEKEPEVETQEPPESQPPPTSNEDLEDGEIEDDDEEEEMIPPNDEAALAQQPPQNNPQQQLQQPLQQQQMQTSPTHQSPGNNTSETDIRSSEHNKFGDGNKFGSPNSRFHGKYRDRWRFERREERRGSSGDDKSGKHLTEAEKSVMYLHKLERMEREKREKYKREHGVLVDDFASNIEKAIANVLKKEQKDKEGNIIKTSDDEKEEIKRGKKRKKKDKDKKKSKQRRMESPKGDGSYPSDDNKDFQGFRGVDNKPLFGSPRDVSGGIGIGGANNNRTPPFESRSPSRSENEEGTESDGSLNRIYDDKGGGEKQQQQQQRQRDRNFHNNNRKNSKSRGRNSRDRRDHRKHNQDRNKDKKATVSEQQPKDAQSVCVFYMQGKCHKGDDCTYSHEVLPPMKLELCKFYLMDCCAKGDKCLYMHSEFPCKFYHTGLKCFAEENCKFAHGKPLSGGLKQILFKHIETAPKEILGDFPRLTRDGAINMINQTQKTLETTYGCEGGGGSGGDDDKDAIPSLFDISVAMPGDLQNDGEHKEKKEKTEKSGNRERKSRWQDADPAETAAALQEQQIQMALRIKGFYAERDQDMRVTSNGDVDMRTMPPHLGTMPLSIPPPSIVATTFPKGGDTSMIFSQDVDIRNTTGDVDIRNTTSFFDTKDVDIRRPPPNYTPLDVDTRHIDFAKDVDIRHFNNMPVERVDGDTDDRDLGEESNLEIVTDEDHRGGGQHMFKGDVDSRMLNSDGSVTSKDIDTRIGFGGTLPPNLPKKQMELFLRIQAQQKDTVPDVQGPEPDDNDDANVDWYSDDDDDCRLTIKDDVEETKFKVEDKQERSPSPTTSVVPQIKPNEVMEKLGDLSKIDISAEVTKLLSSISQGALSPKEAIAKVSAPPKDPRLATHSSNTMETPKMPLADPRRARVPSTESKLKETKLSVYEQGSLSIENAKKDVDLRNVGKDTDLRTPLGDLDLRSGMRPDIDLRNLNLPFKAIQNYTPATEVDASINSHPPILWKVMIVDIPQPDYTGLKLTVQDAHTTGDPRLRKIFRLSVDEKESPASPKESPKATPLRVDPRRRKMEENKTDTTSQMTYSQQLNVLQSSAFYQSLTSNQKLLLNQELAAKTDGSGCSDPVLTGLLSNLGLLPNVSVPTSLANIPNSSALNILANINNVPMGSNPAAMLGPNPLLMGQNPNQAMIGTNVPPPGIIGQNLNFPHVGPNMISQNPNAMGPHGGMLGPVPPPNDFQLNFDPRQGGLLGNAPLDFPPPHSGPNYGPGGADDYYPDGDVGPVGGAGGGGGGGTGNGGGFRGGGNRNDGRGYGRDNRSRRGRNFNNRNGNRNFRNNRNHNRSNNNNRSRTPP